MTTRADRLTASLTSFAQILRMGTIVTTVFALLSMLSLVWAGYWMIRAPYIGFDWSVDTRTVVTGLDPNGPAAGKVRLGDEIVSIDGVSLVSYGRTIGFLQVGDTLDVRLRDGQGAVRSERVTATTPNALSVVLDRITPLVVSLAFWVSGLVVIAVATRAGPETLVARLYFAFCQLIVVFIAAAQVGSVVSEPATRMMLSFGAWLGAVAVDFHVRFPRAWPRTPLLRLGVAILYGVAGLTTLLAYGLPGNGGLESLGVFFGLWIVLCLSTVILILVLAALRVGDDAATFRARMVAFTALLGFSPALVFTMLPDVLLLTNYVAPISSTFVFMGLVPLGYAYAILRYRLIRYDGTVSRALGYVMAIVAMLFVLGLVALGLQTVGIFVHDSGFLVWMLILTVLVAVAFEPIRRRIQGAVDYMFDRPWAEFRTTLRGVEDTLAETVDVSTWAEALCRQFGAALEITPVGLLFRRPQNPVFRLVVNDPAGATTALVSELDSALPLIAHVAALSRPALSRDLRVALEGTALTEVEQAWLTNGAFDLWWPIHAHGHLQAVLLLGRKDGGFSTEEVELLALASRQIGVALENAEFARELEQLSRAAFQTREEERRRVSRELHDHIIQPLVGLNFSLASMRDVPEAAEARTQISDLITHVRRISADLRPPALDEVGLGAAARGLVRTFARASGLQVDFAVLPSEDLDVPEPIASTYFSALRESLTNIQRHAQASRVSVLLEARTDNVILVVHDDGVGFAPPPRLGQLASTGHFGLLGLQERLAAIGGTLNLHAWPGKGTRLECQAPLPHD